MCDGRSCCIYVCIYTNLLRHVKKCSTYPVLAFVYVALLMRARMKLEMTLSCIVLFKIMLVVCCTLILVFFPLGHSASEVNVFNEHLLVGRWARYHS